MCVRISVFVGDFQVAVRLLMALCFRQVREAEAVSSPEIVDACKFSVVLVGVDVVVADIDQSKFSTDGGDCWSFPVSLVMHTC